MSDARVVGLRPAFPPPLQRWTWLTEPVRAERLAALRIGVAAVLLWDILFTYWPRAHDFFGRGSLGSPEVFTNRHIWWRWSFLRAVDGALATAPCSCHRGRCGCSRCNWRRSIFLTEFTSWPAQTGEMGR